MTEKTYKNIIWLVVAGIMVFAPLVRGAVRLWSITPVEAALAVLVFLWLWRVARSPQPAAHSQRDKEWKFRKTKIDLPIFLFVGLAGVSCFFSIYKYASLLETLRLLAVVGIFYLTVNNFGRRMSFRLVILIIIMGAGMSLLGLGQYFGGLNHSWWIPHEFLAATYVNHNHFAGYLEIAIPLTLGILLAFSSSGALEDKFGLSSMPRYYRGVFKTGLAAALLIMFLALLFSQSRGAWVSLAVSLIIMNLVLVKKRVLRKGSLFILLLFLVLGIVFVYSGEDAVSARLRTVEKINNEGFIEGRQKIWQGSMDMIKANPLLGTGVGTFLWGFSAYRPKGLVLRAHYAHNDYLHMMAETGVLALPLMLWIIGAIIRRGCRWKNFGLSQGIILGGTVGILSLSLHGLVDFNFHIPANMLLVSFLAGVIMRDSGLIKSD